MDELENPKPEADAGTVAFLDQETAAFQESKEEFAAFYGFDHDCTCDTDYTDGKVGLVTQCFMRLTSQALSRAAQATQELRVLGGMVEHLLRVNNDLIQKMIELGHEKELQEYFDMDDDADAPVEQDLEDDDPSDAEELEDTDDGEDDSLVGT